MTQQAYHHSISVHSGEASREGWPMEAVQAKVQRAMERVDQRLREEMSRRQHRLQQEAHCDPQQLHALDTHIRQVCVCVIIPAA